MKIYYSTPYDKDKNIGKAYNEFCSLISNDDDWIVLQDGDMMYLTPDWGRLIHESLSNNGNEFGLIGCYTNRLRGTHQLHEGKFNNDHELKYHYHIAIEYAKKPAMINDIGNLLIAGVFMAFQKKTWKLVGGFEEKSIIFDTLFSRKINSYKLKKGLINNMYCYHWYRGWTDRSPKSYIQHLL